MLNSTLADRGRPNRVKVLLLNPPPLRRKQTRQGGPSIEFIVFLNYLEGSKGAAQKGSEGDKYIDLGKKKRATVRSFKDIPLLDIREYYGIGSDEKPGKKGISLTLEQVRILDPPSGHFLNFTVHSGKF